MKPDFGMLWLGSDVLTAMSYFRDKYGHVVDYVLAAVIPADCPAELFIEDHTIEKGHLLLGSYNFRPS